METDIVRMGAVNFTSKEIRNISGGTYAFVFTNKEGNVYVDIRK